jgi:hypothetical protein
MLSKNSLLNLENTKVLEKKHLNFNFFEKQLVKVELDYNCCITENHSTFSNTKTSSSTKNPVGFSSVSISQIYLHKLYNNYCFNSHVNFLNSKKQSVSVGVLKKLTSLNSSEQKNSRRMLILLSPIKGGFKSCFMGVIGFIHRIQIERCLKSFLVLIKSTKKFAKIKKFKKMLSFFSVSRKKYLLFKLLRFRGRVTTYNFRFLKKSKPWQKNKKTFSSMLNFRFFLVDKKKKVYKKKDRAKKKIIMLEKKKRKIRLLKKILAKFKQIRKISSSN